MKWCCIGFKSHYDSAGEQGHAILIGRNSLGEPDIVMQYRAVNLEEENQVDSKVMMSLVTDIAIIFCPWCGRNVRKWYSKYVDELFKEGLKITY